MFWRMLKGCSWFSAGVRPEVDNRHTTSGAVHHAESSCKSAYSNCVSMFECGMMRAGPLPRMQCKQMSCERHQGASTIRCCWVLCRQRAVSGKSRTRLALKFRGAGGRRWICKNNRRQATTPAVHNAQRTNPNPEIRGFDLNKSRLLRHASAKSHKSLASASSQAALLSGQT